MTLKMRIVGLNDSKRGDDPHAIFVQFNYEDGEGWRQLVMSENVFSVMMQKYFLDYYNEYRRSGGESSICNFFYHYGETEDMIRRGEAYVFEDGDIIGGESDLHAACVYNDTWRAMSDNPDDY